MRNALVSRPSGGSSYIHTARSRTTTTTAHLPAMDVSKDIPNLCTISLNLMRRKSTRFDDDHVNYHKNIKDTSIRHVPPSLPTVDVSKHVHNVSDVSHNTTR